MTTVMKRYAFAVVGIVVALIVGIIYGAQQASQARAADQRQEALAELEHTKDETQQALDAAQQAVYEELTGSDVTRMAQDRAIFEDMTTTMLTWDDHESYTAARTALIEDFGMSEDSSFVTSFFPEAPVTVDSEGNEYPYLDVAGLSSSPGELTVDLVGVTGTTYRYVVFVDMESAARIGESTSRSSVPLVLFASVDSDGQLREVAGYSSVETPRSTS